MEKAQTTRETARGTIKEGEKIILDNVEVELKTVEFSSEQKVLQGSFKITPDISNPLLPSLYELVLEDGCSYQIFVKGVYSRSRQMTLVRFLVVPEE